jgi:hypothetical protein
MHLYGAGETDDFLTFDKTLVRRAKKLSDIVPVVVPTLTA